jgi:hypothetical protein
MVYDVFEMSLSGYKVEAAKPLFIQQKNTYNTKNRKRTLSKHVHLGCMLKYSKNWGTWDFSFIEQHEKSMFLGQSSAYLPTDLHKLILRHQQQLLHAYSVTQVQ